MYTYVSMYIIYYMYLLYIHLYLLCYLYASFKAVYLLSIKVCSSWGKTISQTLKISLLCIVLCLVLRPYELFYLHWACLFFFLCPFNVHVCENLLTLLMTLVGDTILLFSIHVVLFQVHDSKMLKYLLPI